MASQLPFSNENIDETAMEKVYVDWPEENIEDYRFVSSRMDDIESDYHPLVAAEDIRMGVDVTRNLTDLKITSKPPRQSNTNRRYEDLSRRQRARQKNSSIPPLDLVSQHSSIEIPGARGAIDIDFRSSSDSMSEECGIDDGDDGDVERDSLDDRSQGLRGRPEDAILHTTLPSVPHEELLLNPGEYNSSRYSQNNGGSRRLSESTIASQYRSVAPHYTQYETTNLNGRLEEQTAFEAVQQRFKHSLSSTAQDSGSTVKQEMTSANSMSKLHKSKPTLLVAPQIKQPLTDKAPNFIELNKVTLNQQKPLNQSSYSNKFADRQRKDSPRRTVKKSAQLKEGATQAYNYMDKADRNPTLSAQDYWSKRDRSVERLTGEHKEYRDEIYDQTQRPLYSHTNPNVIYAFNQYGEPLVINANEVFHPTNLSRPSEIPHLPSSHQQFPDYYPQPNMASPNFNNALTSPRPQRSPHYIPDMRRSAESEQIFKDAPYKRQPTLYDEKLLEKKTRIVSSERIGSHLPPLPSSSDSNISINAGNSYVANLRKKEVNYEQYTLRDFRNIKQINSVGGLGPNIGTESHKQMRNKLTRQKNYSQAVQDKNQELLRMREKEKKVNSSSASKVMDNSYREMEEQMYSDGNELPTSTQERIDNHQDNENKSEKNLPKSTFSSANSKIREQVAKRDVMINYSKVIKEKQLKKQISKSKVIESTSEVARKDIDNGKVMNELFNNSDLDRLLQRHEYDKKMTDQIRQKWEKIP